MNHCQQAVATWHAGSSKINAKTQKQQKQLPVMHFFHANGLDIKGDEGESLSGFDRIYAGAGITTEQHKKIRQLLSPGGVLVAPVGDELLKVVRIRSKSRSTSGNDNDIIDDEEENDCNFTTETILGVTFASLLKYPKIPTVIPATQWDISNHRFYPDSFQKATKALLLCRNSNVVQPIQRRPNDEKNVAATLPKEVWLHILSFTTRKCRYYDFVESRLFDLLPFSNFCCFSFMK